MNEQQNTQVAAIQQHKLNLFFEDQPVRIIVDDDDVPWWVAKDVCDVLGIVNNRDALSGLDEDELASVKTTSGGQIREMKVVNEPGLYSLIHSSRKPAAKAFKRWVNHEVLPSIRKTGTYTHPAAQIAPEPQMLLGALESASRMIELMGRTLERFDQRLDLLEQTGPAPRQMPLPSLSGYRLNGLAGIRAFLAGACRLNQDAVVDKRTLHHHYRNWCRATGELPYNYSNFCKGLYQTGLPIRPSQRKTGHPGPRRHLLRGVAIPALEAQS